MGTALSLVTHNEELDEAGEVAGGELAYEREESNVDIDSIISHDDDEFEAGDGDPSLGGCVEVSFQIEGRFLVMRIRLQALQVDIPAAQGVQTANAITTITATKDASAGTGGLESAARKPPSRLPRLRLADLL
ncbi:hypothetical protein CGLO_10895 [Colletotrichum gloeosporioides Cg-14]|uniref:Uncharacterized protein n=1 Tax=Colletotrichum gloeosporioides (strain Cg-14) TaxID=1237896 RepID=T0K9L5_COLGC|nr:hypothetical protein CGLO_10895 [Colletotrichum gloeosporioides Cg-14]